MPPADPPEYDFRLERQIHVRRRGVLSTGPLTVGPVRWLPERGRWACGWSIHVVHPERVELYGDDPLQALDVTICFVTRLVRGSIEDGTEMWWQFEGDACGMWWNVMERP